MVTGAAVMEPRLSCRPDGQGKLRRNLNNARKPIERNHQLIEYVASEDDLVPFSARDHAQSAQQVRADPEADEIDVGHLAIAQDGLDARRTDQPGPNFIEEVHRNECAIRAGVNQRKAH